MILFELLEESSARCLTSLATTEKPLPYWPACTDSMAAFMASRLVCSAMSRMEATISLTFRDDSSMATMALEDSVTARLPLSATAERSPEISLVFCDEL
jgi:hypothetical protein